MKCPKCNGKGKVLDYVAERDCHGEWEKVLREIPCDKCQRKPMTEEEWLRTVTTEQLVEELLAWWTDGANTHSHFGLFQHEIDGAKEKIVKWLKEKHK